VIPEVLTICRLEPETALPPWATDGTFFSITKTAEELSIVLPQERVPTGVRAEGAWRAFKVEGPLPFFAIGVLASMAEPLARAGISLFAISTFDTDYILVRSDQLEPARLSLVGAGHTIR
jgi:hypothetical protein